jgi:outer membrane protein assembly factor BamB
MMGQDYSSPVLANGNIYFTSRGGEVYVYAAGPEFKLLGQNHFSDGGDFSATPAISDGQIFIRSSKYLYCVAEKAAKGQ